LFIPIPRLIGIYCIYLDLKFCVKLLNRLAPPCLKLLASASSSADWEIDASGFVSAPTPNFQKLGEATVEK
jgi:hypothetical protein